MARMAAGRKYGPYYPLHIFQRRISPSIYNIAKEWLPFKSTFNLFAGI
jgi:hypothetical protein